MSFEWDPRKAVANLSKHGLDFADVVGVFDDERALWFRDDRHVEERHIIVGQDFMGRLAVIVFTTGQSELIRIISARKATTRESKQYWQTK